MHCAGEMFGHYRLDESLGSGSVGEVFRATDTVWKRQVAIKLVSEPAPDTPDDRPRLLLAARTSAARVHPHAVVTFEAGEIEGTSFVAMELVVGETLRAILARGAPQEDFVRWLRQVASALASASAVGITHGGVRPENVMVRATGEAVLLDFGLTRSVGAVGAAYRAPDAPGGAASAKGDQFSWGVMAKECFGDEGIPAWLSAVVARTLENDPAKRFGSMHEVERRLERGSAAPIAPPPDAAPTAPESTADKPPQDWPAVPPAISRRRQIVGVVALTVIVLSVLGVGAVRWYQFFEAQHHEANERHEAEVLFADGMTAWRTRPLPAAPKLWYKSTRHDAGLAGAWLRLALYHVRFEGKTDVGRSQYRTAVASQARFSPRDRAFSDAVAPLFEKNADARSAAVRLAALTVSDPSDHELCLWHALVAEMAGDEVAARAGFEDARRIDPDHLTALTEEGRLLLTGDEPDQEAAIPVLERCVSLRPDGFACEALYIQALEATRKLDKSERQARVWARADPKESRPYMHLIWALGSRRAPPEEIDDAVKQFADRMGDESSTAQARRAWASIRAVWIGDFATDEREASELAKHDVTAADPFESPEHEAWMVVEARLESGDAAGAKRAAAAFLDERKAKRAKGAAASDEDLDHSKIPTMLGLLRDARPEEWRAFTEQRAARLAALRATPPSVRARDDFWISQFATVPMTLDDAREAVEAAHALPVSRSIREFGFMGAGDLGLALSLAGAHDEALRALRASVASCNGFGYTAEWMRAHLTLARLLEADGDVAGARALYQAVVDTWGGAKPRSVAADEARSRLAALVKR